MRRGCEAGFTLLEVMIAITILAIAFAAILSSESASINLTRKTKDLNMAGWLAHNIMVESEQKYEGKAFTELPKEEHDTFKIPYDRFKWTREIKELKFPDMNMPKPNNQPGEDQMTAMLVKVMSNYLNKAVRELVVTVTWPEGKGEQHVTLATYLVDFTTTFDFSTAL